MKKLLSKNDLCSAILSNKCSIASSENSQLNNFLDVDQKSYQDNSKKLFSELNQFSKKEIAIILNELKTKEQDFTDILLQHNFTFQQHIDVIKKNSIIFQHPDSSSNSQSLACMVQLYSYLSLFMNFSQSSKEYYEELINSFLLSLDTNYVKSNNKLHTICLSCFFYLMRSYLQLSDISEKFVMNSIIMFFTENKNTKSKSIFRSHSQKVSKSIPSDFLILFLYSAIIFAKVQSKYLNDLIQLFDCIIQENYLNNFPKEIAVSFLKVIADVSPSIQSLIFFDHIMPFVEVDLISNYLKLLPNSIIAEIENSEEHFADINITDDSKAFKLPNSTNVSTNIFTLVTWKTFDKPINLALDLERIKFPELIDLTDVIRAEVLEMIDYIRRIVKRDNKLVLKLFDLIQLSSSNIANSKYSVEISVAFLHLLLSIVSSSKSKRKSMDGRRTELLQFFPTQIFLNDVVLNPSYTIFSYREDNDKTFLYLNSLRSQLFDIFIEKGVSSINSIFYEIVYYPMLFAEFTYRLSLSNVQIGKDEVVVISPMFVFAMNYYVHFKDLNEDQLSMVNLARESIFYYFDTLFKSNEKLTIFFQDTFFIESVLNLTFEYQPRQIILSHVSSYLQLIENLNNNECVNKINTLILNASNSLDDPQYAELCADYLKMINKVIQISRLNAFYFTPLNSLLCQNMLKLKKGDEKSKYFIFEFITFLALTSDFHILSASETDALQTSIISSFGPEPSKELFIKLVNLIAGQCLTSLSPSFEIRQPSILRALMAIYLKSTILQDLFTFVAKLLQFSMKNCIEAHKGEVDMFLIDLLYKWRNDKEISVNLVASSMSLFMLICKAVSSFVVVQKFISLFAPIHRRYLSKYHCLIIKSMCNILDSVRKKPLSCLPLREPCTFEIEGLKGEHIEKGFSVIFWIFHPSSNPNYKVQIFSLRDIKNQRIALLLQGNNIYTEFNMHIPKETKSTQWSRTTDINLNENEWNLVTLTFEPDGDTTTVTYSLNNIHYSKASIFPFLISLGMVKAQIGGFSSNVSDSPSLLGSIGIFNKMSHSQIDQFYQVGSNSRKIDSRISEFKTICFFVSDEKDGQIYLNNIASLNEIKLKKESIQSVIPNNFCSIYLKKFNLCMILPLFAQWNLLAEDGSSIPNHQDLTCELLVNSLTVFTEAQTQFSASGGFTILLHLLQSCDERFITYKFYLQLCNLFDNLVDIKCKEQLYSNILMNVDLWLKALPEDHLSIVRHWSTELVPKTTKLALKLIPISWILSNLRIHYWYTPVEKYTITIDEDRFADLNVNECRSFLIQIAFQLAQTKIEENDFRCLVSHILTCRDFQQTEELLHFLNHIIKDCKTSIKSVKDSFKLISLLQYLFNSQNNELISSSFEIIAFSHNNQLINDYSLDSHFDLILHQLTSSFVTRDLLPKLLEITKNNVPELFPICSWAAMNIGDSAMREMLTTLKPSKKYEINEFWAIWPIVALFKADEKLQRFIGRYLIKCSSNYHYLFATCEIVGRALHEDIDKAKKIIIVEFGKLLLRDDYDAGVDEIVEYFLLVKHYLFFHCEAQQNISINKEYEKSPINTSTEITNVSVNNSPKKLPRKERRRKARYSIRRDSIENYGYSQVDQENAISLLNPEQELEDGHEKVVSYDDSLHANLSPVSFKSKRTSMFTIGHATFTNQKKKRTDKKILSMTPLELDEKIREIASEPISYSFGLKMSNEMKWDDLDVAQQAISVFLRDPDTRVAETILLICSFSLHYSTKHIQTVVSKLNIHNSSLNSAFNFFLHHCELVNYKATDVGPTTKPSNYLQTVENKNDRMISASPLMFLKHFLKYESNNAAISMDISEMINESIVGLSSSLMAKFTDDYGNLLDTASKLWNQNWRTMSMDKAPWHRSISRINKIHFKRDFTLCSNLCPVKLRRNYLFDDHMKASLLRDTGSVVSAQKILDKYKEELTNKYNSQGNVYTLFEVVEDKSCNQGNFIDSLDEANESKCVVELPCEFVKVNKTAAGIFALFSKKIILTKSEKKSIVIDLSDIRNVFLRTHFHHPTAIEIFTVFGKSYFINFPNLNPIPILKSIKTFTKPFGANIQCTDFQSYFQSKKVTEEWLNRRISNFEYLMNLNMLSGRTFNDPSQYPILPWIISDYESEKLDLNDPNFFRDLSKPIGAINEERLQQLIEKWEMFDSMGINSYLYSSGYVCPLSVYLWLIRQEPFTSLHINLQSGKFDYPARLFTSIGATYNTSTHQPNDYRELIPEFYSSPEFLINSNKFDLGSLNGSKVNDVELPAWASSPYEFVYLMRKAMESDYVSDHIHQWIDLIWGEKQRGEKAVKANNIYLKEMYDDIWTHEKLSDPNERASIEAILCHVGQIPPQLFDKPHPIRGPAVAPTFSIEKPVIFELPTSHLITSSIYPIVQQKKRFINFSAVDLSGQLIEVSFPLSYFSESGEKKVIFKRRSSSKELFQSKPIKIPHDFIVSSQISKHCQTARKDAFGVLSKSKFTLVAANGYDIILADASTGASSLYIHHRSEIVQVAASQNSYEWIIIADRDAYLTLYHQNKFKYTLQTFMKSITCLSMNFGFRQVVCGTSDNSLLFCSISSNYLSIFRVVELDDGFQPIKIIITNSWGFVVVYLTKMNERKLSHYLALYSINGDLIKRVEISIQIQQLETYSTNDGFDFIVARDDAFNLYSFEAFYLDLKNPFYNCDSSISNFFTIPDKSMAVQITQEGKIIFIPFVV